MRSIPVLPQLRRAAASLRKALPPLTLLMLTVAGTVNAFGVTCFLAPVALYDSGISGTAMLIAQLSRNTLPLGLALVVLNVPLFLYGLRRLGGVFTIRATYTVFVYAIAAVVIQSSVPMADASPLCGQDLLLCAVFGGIISGIGSGLTIRFGGAIDGMEVLAVRFAKRLGVTVGTFVMTYNAMLYLLAGILMHSWILPLYSIITYMAGLKTIDFVVEGFDKAKAATIITTRADEICKALSASFGRGITVLEARGYYSGEGKTMLYLVLNRFQIARMRTIVHGLDEGAFIAITEVSDLFGSSVKGESNSEP